MEHTLKHKALSGILWKLLENFGVQAIQLVTAIVLARLIDPAYYAPLSLTVVFITFATIFVQRGFEKALVQRKDVTDDDFSTAFYLCIGAALALYLAYFAAAPAIARYYRTPEAARVLRVMGLILFFYAANTVLNAIVARRMQFFQIFVASLIAIVASGAISIAMAAAGFGTWALVAQQMVQMGTICLVLWCRTGFRPRRVLSLRRAGQLLSYGWKLLVAGVIDTLFLQMSALIIGKIGGTQALTYHNKGRQFPAIIGADTNTAIQTALFPVLSVKQDEPELLHRMVRRAMAGSAFLMAPLLIGLAAVAEPMVRIVLTEKWLPCVPYLRIFCVCFLVYPITTTGTQALNARGRSDIFLKLEIIRKGAGAAMLLGAFLVFRTALAAALAVAATYVFSALLNIPVLNKNIGYRLREQAADVLPPFLLAGLMGALVYAITRLGLSDWSTLLLQVAAGVLIYAAGAYLTRMRIFFYLLGSAREFFAKRRGGSNGGSSK